MKGFVFFSLCLLLTNCSLVNRTGTYSLRKSGREKASEDFYAKNFFSPTIGDTVGLSVSIFDDDIVNVSFGPMFLPVIPAFPFSFLFPAQDSSFVKTRLVFHCVNEINIDSTLNVYLIADGNRKFWPCKDERFTGNINNKDFPAKPFLAVYESKFCLPKKVKRKAAIVIYNSYAQVSDTVLYYKKHDLNYYPIIAH